MDAKDRPTVAASSARCTIDVCSGPGTPDRQDRFRCAVFVKVMTAMRPTTPTVTAMATTSACNATGRPTKPPYGKDHQCARSKDAIDPTRQGAIALPTTDESWQPETQGPMSRSDTL